VDQKVSKNFDLFSISRFYVPISQQQLQLEAYDPSQEKILIPPLSTYRIYIGVSPTAFYELGQKVSDTIPILRITAIAPEPTTVSVCSERRQCGRICKAQTCAHYGAEPSRLAKQFPHEGSTTSRNLHLFRSFLAFTSPISQQSLKIEPYKQRTYLFNRPCTPCRNLVTPVPLKKLCRMRMAGLCQFY